MAHPTRRLEQASRECGRQENATPPGKPCADQPDVRGVGLLKAREEEDSARFDAGGREGLAHDAMKAVKDKKLRAPSSRTLHQEVDEWFAGAREGRILNRQKQQYKPAVLRIYGRRSTNGSFRTR